MKPVFVSSKRRTESCALSIAVIAVLGAWRPDRRLLSESREGLRDQETDRTAALCGSVCCCAMRGELI
jgi:hypothetical protein